MLLFLPITTALVVELFVLPVNQFTFRPWEALLYTGKAKFYENMKLQGLEWGDRYKYKQIQPAKRTEWTIDSYGRRNNFDISKVINQDIVIVGDSNIAGSYLTQQDTISEVLSRETGRAVYNYSPGSKKTFFSDPLMRLASFKVIIVEAKPGEFIDPDFADWNSVGDLHIPEEAPHVDKSSSSPNGEEKWHESALALKRLEVAIDRLKKRALWNYVRTRIGLVEFASSKAGVNKVHRSQTSTKDAALEDPQHRFIRQSLEMKAEAQRRGADFIMLLMPWQTDLLPAVGRLRAAGVKIVAFESENDKNYSVPLDWFYHEEDSHWTEEAVTFAAKLLAEAIEQSGSNYKSKVSSPIWLDQEDAAILAESRISSRDEFPIRPEERAPFIQLSEMLERSISEIRRHTLLTPLKGDRDYLAKLEDRNYSLSFGTTSPSHQRLVLTFSSDRRLVGLRLISAYAGSISPQHFQALKDSITEWAGINPTFQSHELVESGTTIWTTRNRQVQLRIKRGVPMKPYVELKILDRNLRG